MDTKSKNVSYYILSEIEKMFPDAKCELNYNNIYELLIAVVLSAQTTDKRVNEVTKELFKQYSNISLLANANIQDVEQLIRPLGLSKIKSKNIILLSQKIIDEYNGNVPNTISDLTKLPGVGRKCANVILAEGFHVPALAVDTHVKRVANRLKLSNTSDTAQIEEDLKNIYLEEDWYKVHLLLLFFGRYFCTSKRPNCKICPFISICKTKL